MKKAAKKRNNSKFLSPEEKAGLLELREQKEVSRFLLQDATERKHKRLGEVLLSQKGDQSKEIEIKKCQDALIEYISSTPTSSTQKSTISSTKNSAVSTPKESDIFTPIKSLSTNIVPKPLLEDQSSSSSIQETNTLDEDDEEQMELEQAIEENSGSDIDEDVLDNEIVNINHGRRDALTHLADQEDNLPPDTIELLKKMYALDDSVLREIASSDELLNFDWSNDCNTFTGQRETFTGQAGPTFCIDGMTPLDIFKKIWDDSIIDLIVTETNRYAHQLKLSSLELHSRLHSWIDITENDIWLFFAVIMLQSLIPLSVEHEYWYPCLPHLAIRNFKNIMPYKKFLLIKNCLHFVDNTAQPEVNDENKKLQKIQPVIDHLNDKFSSLYLPEQNIAIDESLLLWKGKLSFAQRIKTKVAKVGIKSYELCESRTGYLWKMIIYTGKSDKRQPEQDLEINSCEPETNSHIVYNLIRPLLNKGHTLVMDNFYNSPLLSRTLKHQKTDTMGTLRLSRDYVPETLRNKTKNNLRKGEIAFSQTKDLTITVCHDSNIVSMISTFHKIEVGGQGKHGQNKHRPKVILHYNLSMEGVDKKDQTLQAYPMERVRNIVWYKKLFRRLLNVSIYNAFVIYNHKNITNQRQFRAALADEILKTLGTPVIENKLAQIRNIDPKSYHFPTKNNSNKSRCKWCAKKNIDSSTVWKCDTCNVDLCIIACFKDYHIDEERELPKNAVM